MKSREGTVVDADELMEEMVSTAKSIAQGLGKLEGMSNQDADTLYEVVGMGALKYFMLKVDPKKRMLFNPEESVDFNGNTGPFIQYTYARIHSLKRKFSSNLQLPDTIQINIKEKELIKLMIEFPILIQDSASNYSPAMLANYVYTLVKEYNNYYQSNTILKAQTEQLINFRLALSLKVAEIIKTSMSLLGIDVPERM